MVHSRAIAAAEQLPLHVQHVSNLMNMVGQYA